MRKRNCEETHDGFPTNGIKYESKDVNYRHEGTSNKELQKEVKRLRGLLEKVRWCEIIYSLANYRTEVMSSFRRHKWRRRKWHCWFPSRVVWCEYNFMFMVKGKDKKRLTSQVAHTRDRYNVGFLNGLKLQKVLPRPWLL